jgi:glycosyltransferase involved in cell wall biosynthesis
MKILSFDAYHYPEQVASAYLGDNIREEWQKRGFENILFVPSPSRGLDKKVIKEYKKKKIEYLNDGKTILFRFPLMDEEGHSLLSRVWRYLFLCWKFARLGVKSKYAENCDVIYLGSTPPIIGFAAVYIKKKRHIPFIYNLQDIFPDSLVGAGLASKNSIIWKIGRKMEDYIYHNADNIIVISEDFKRNIIEKGVPENKIDVVYNWVDEQSVVDIPRSKNKLFDKYGLDRSKFYITYNGNIGLTQNIDMLVEVAHDLESNSDIQFVLVGNGAYRLTLEKIIYEQNIKNIILIPFQPYEDISHVFSLGDISLVISKPGVGVNSVPSKTWSIMSASRPVLANFDENELKDILEINKCGLFTKAGDKNAFEKAIFQFYNNQAFCKECGHNGRHFVMQNLTKSIGAVKYTDIVYHCVENYKRKK